MNNKNLMISRGGSDGVPQYVEKQEPGMLSPDSPGYANSVSMLRRVMPAQQPASQAVETKEITGVPEIPDIPDVPDKDFLDGVVPAQASPAQRQAQQIQNQAQRIQQAAQRGTQQVQAGQRPFQKPQASQTAAGQKPAQKPVQAAAPAASAQKPAQPVGTKTVAPARIRQGLNPDELCKAYIEMFKKSFGMDLSASICYENMRRMCEADVKNPENTLYFMENTYWLSTLLYLASNLPIVFVTSVLAEKNRKNILKYVTIEVENGSKPYQELRDLRIRRWGRKFENMAVNDAMTVTPGVTGWSQELVAVMLAAFQDTCTKLKRFNKELTGIVAKFDDSALNDVTYIYSNWWYFLQGFENVPEMRTYVMAITDDTRRNLKI